MFGIQVIDGPAINGIGPSAPFGVLSTSTRISERAYPGAHPRI